MSNLKKSNSAPFFRTKLFSGVLKIGISIGLFYTLYSQLIAPDDASTSFVHFKNQVLKAPSWILLLIIALVPINLVLEAIKFRRLLQFFVSSTGNVYDGEISLYNCLKRVFAGLAFGLLTPNRVGEYAGRLTGTLPGQRSKSVIATLVGGMAQQLPLILGGVASILFLSGSNIPTLGSGSFVILLCIGSTLLGLGFYRADILKRLIENSILPFVPYARIIEKLKASSKWFERIWKSICVAIAELTKGDAEALELRRDVLLLSVCRYVVYISQLSLAFIYCGLDVPIQMCFLGTAFLLFSQTFIPLPTVLQALARVQIGLLIWSVYAPDVFSLTAGSMLIFVLNLALPAFIGLIIILRSDVAKTLTFKNA